MPNQRHTPRSLVQRLWLFGRAELGVLTAFVIIAGGLWAFLGLVDEMGEGESHAFDQAILSFLRPTANPHDAWGPHWFERAMADLTTLGGTAVLTLLALIVVGFLLIQKRVASALLVVFALGGGVLLSEGTKALIARDRPPMIYRAVETMSASFPSGHAMLSTVTYLTLGTLLAQVMPKKRLKAFVFSVAVLIAVIVGLTRVYLGAHWMTDVLAGWSLGAAWAMVCWLGAWAFRRYIRKHDTPISEPPVADEPQATA